MATALLDGVQVVDLAGEPAALAGRILADLGARVALVEPPGGHPLRAQPERFTAWAAGKTSVVGGRRPTTRPSTRSSPARTSCSTPPASPARSSSTRAARRTRCGSA